MSALETVLVLAAAVLLIAALVIAVGRLVRRRMLDPPGVKAAAQALRPPVWPVHRCARD